MMGREINEQKTGMSLGEMAKVVAGDIRNSSISVDTLASLKCGLKQFNALTHKWKPRKLLPDLRCEECNASLVAAATEGYLKCSKGCGRLIGTPDWEGYLRVATP